MSSSNPLTLSIYTSFFNKVITIVISKTMKAFKFLMFMIRCSNHIKLINIWKEEKEGVDVSCVKSFWETEDLSLLLVHPLSKLSKKTLSIFHSWVVSNQTGLKDVKLTNDTIKEKRLTYINIYYDAFLFSDNLVNHYVNF